MTSMKTLNRLSTAKNPFQGTTKKVLCVCSAGLLRSPTLAHLLSETYGYNTRAVGSNQSHALIPINEVLLYWADEVVFVEKSVHSETMGFFDDFVKKSCNCNLITLAVPDQYEYGNSELRGILLDQYQFMKAHIDNREIKTGLDIEYPLFQDEL